MMFPIRMSWSGLAPEKAPSFGISVSVCTFLKARSAADNLTVDSASRTIAPRTLLLPFL